MRLGRLFRPYLSYYVLGHLHLNEMEAAGVSMFARKSCPYRILLAIRQLGSPETPRKYILMPCPSMGPKWFWTIQIILVEYQLFWRVQIILEISKLIKLVLKKSNLNLTKMIWTQPKRFGGFKIILDIRTR